MRRLRPLVAPILLAFVAAGILAAFSGHRFLHQSKAPHFVYQAMGLLEGRLDIPVDPPNLEDWVLRSGRWYVSFPAFPAVAMMPFVALFGYQFNDTSFTVFVGALSLALFFLALRRLSALGESPRGERENLALAAIMGFGTVFFYCAIRGEVWFTAQVMGVGLTSLYLMAATRAKRPLLAGLAWSAATLTRTPLMFAGIYFVAEAWRMRPFVDESPSPRRDGLRWAAKRLAWFGLGAAPLAIAHALFNHARFGKLSEFGHRLFLNNRVNADIERWGLFDLHYLPRNLSAAFAKLPTVSFEPFRIGYDPHGMSLLLTTPLLILLLAPPVTKLVRRFSSAAAGPSPASGGGPTRAMASDGERVARETAAHSIAPSLWLAVAFTAIPGLFYQNDGYMQFGFRFSLDYTPFLFALLAVQGFPMKSRLFIALAAIGVAVNTWGALAFRGFSG